MDPREPLHCVGRRRKHCARLCVAVYRYYNKTNNTHGGGGGGGRPVGRARVLRLELSQKRGRGGHCSTRARTAGGNRLLSTRT